MPADTANDLLRATARSFYLTLRVLPARVRRPIGLAYLLARTTDTIADTEIVPLEQRLDALQRLRERIQGRSDGPLPFTELARRQGVPAEKLLLEKVEDALTALRECPPDDRRLIQTVLDTITSGQVLDLHRFAAAKDKNGRIVALATAAELDDYTYRVAGCVGEFWSKLCRAHLFPQARLDDAQWIAEGIRFGKGLQLVNILRDLPADLRNGRCYLPLEKLTPAGLTPENLLQLDQQAAFHTVYREYLDQAQSHLTAGWCYTNRLPYAQFRVRLACVWPLLLGAKTIERCRAASPAELRQRVKVPRGEVYLLLWTSTLASPVPLLWRILGRKLNAKAVASGLNLA